MAIYYPYIFVALIVFFFLALNLFAFIHSRVQPLYSDLFLATVLILFAGFRGADLDFIEYEKMFERIQLSSAQSLLEQALIGKDVLFGFLMISISTIGLGTLTLFFISAMISVGVKLVAFRHAFGSSILGLGLYFSSFYFLHDFTQIRLAIAIAFCFLALVFIIKGKYLLYIIFCAVAVGFHAQTFLFFIATLPLLTNFKHKHLLVFLSIVMMGLAFSSISLFLDIVGLRPGADIGATNIKTTAILAILLNSVIVAITYFGSVKKFIRLFDEEIAKVSVLLFFGGLLFLFITLNISEVLAWRIYEMFSTFGIFVIIVCLRSKLNLLNILTSLSYFVLNLTLLLRSDLLVKYTINSTIGAIYGAFY
jgi:hypothetical protein